MGKQVNYDEKRIPSRLAEEYTKFGWVRARNRVSQDLDRKTKGITLSPAMDQDITESIRRKKRFGYNAELVSLEKRYFSALNNNTVYGKGAGFLIFLGVLFLMLTVACAVFAFVPKYPTTVAECENVAKTSDSEGKEIFSIKKIFYDVTLKIETSLFYGDQYFVKDSEVNKDAGESGTIVTVSGDITKAYMIDENGQLVNVPVDTLKEKIIEKKGEKLLGCKKLYRDKDDESSAYYQYVDENDEEIEVNLAGLKSILEEMNEGDIPILRCEKAYLDPNNASTAYYRYYIWYETEKAPLGAFMKVTDLLPEAFSSGLVVFVAIFLVLALVFLIWGICQQNKKKKNIKPDLSGIVARAQQIVAQMKEEDPSLMSREQRHFYSWQKMMAGAINMSNVVKNDNTTGDDDDDMDDFSF